MSEKRKNAHLDYAKAQTIKENDFDGIRFVHQSIPSVNFDEVSYQTHIGKYKIDVPIYITAMTGGTKKAQEINQLLYAIAEKFSIPMALGSYSIGLKDPSLRGTFLDKTMQEKRPLIIANIGADKTVEDAKKTIQDLDADVLQKA